MISIYLQEIVILHIYQDTLFLYMGSQQNPTVNQSQAAKTKQSQKQSSDKQASDLKLNPANNPGTLSTQLQNQKVNLVKNEVKTCKIPIHQSESVTEQPIQTDVKKQKQEQADIHVPIVTPPPQKQVGKEENIEKVAQTGSKQQKNVILPTKQTDKKIGSKQQKNVILPTKQTDKKIGSTEQKNVIEPTKITDKKTGSTQQKNLIPATNQVDTKADQTQQKREIPASNQADKITDQAQQKKIIPATKNIQLCKQQRMGLRLKEEENFSAQIQQTEQIMLKMAMGLSRMNFQSQIGRTEIGNLNLAKKRIFNQFRQLQENQPPSWNVISTSDDTWDVWITAQSTTPFHTQPFLVKIKFPPNYPKVIPAIRIASPELFFHPNIFATGQICGKYLQHQDPCMKIRDRIQGFIHLLSNPNPDSPANNEAAELFEKDYAAYCKKAFKIFRGIEKKKTTQLDPAAMLLLRLLQLAQALKD